MNPTPLFALALLSLAACGDPKDPEDTGEGDTDTDTDSDTDTDADTDPGVLALTSAGFADGAAIPVQYTCDGDNISPPLTWVDAPEGAVAFAVTVIDPDAGNCPHWGLFNLPAGQGGLAEGLSPSGQIPTGAWQTENYEGGVEYSGPCPPSSHDAHHYVFTIHALSAEVADPGTTVSLGDGLAAISGVTLATATLTGTFDH